MQDERSLHHDSHRYFVIFCEGRALLDIINAMDSTTKTAAESADTPGSVLVAITKY